MAGGCASHASGHKHTNPGRHCVYQDTHRNTQMSHRATSPKRLQIKRKKARNDPVKGREGRGGPRRRLDSPVKWLAILAVGLGGRAGGCLRSASCFTGVSSWSPGKAAGFLGGSSRTGLAEGSWDRRTPDSLAEGLSSDTEGTTT